MKVEWDKLAARSYFGVGVLALLVIPAVLAYNFYVRQNRLTYAKFDEFAHDLHDFFATGSRVEAGAAPVAARK